MVVWEQTASAEKGKLIDECSLEIGRPAIVIPLRLLSAMKLPWTFCVRW